MYPSISLSLLPINEFVNEVHTKQEGGQKPTLFLNKEIFSLSGALSRSIEETELLLPIPSRRFMNFRSVM